MPALKYLPVIFLIISACQTFAQRNNVWAFGINAGLDFNGANPEAIVTSINTREGCASISDTNGQLLFYTDGTLVWGRDHNLMPNGSDLTGSGWINTNDYQTWPMYTEYNPQPALIIPVPNEPDRYYVFSKIRYNSGRLTYSIVDMTLNNGLGDVDSAYKAVLIDSGLIPNMVSVPGNHCDVWLLSPLYKNDSIFINAYNINPNGIIGIPVQSFLGTVPEIRYYLEETDWFSIDRGPMAISPDRTMLAMSSNSDSLGIYLSVYRFDAEKGKVFDYLKITNLNQRGVYGICFSPDNSKLYVSRNIGGLLHTPGIYQYDLSVKESAITTNSVTLVGMASNQYYDHQLHRGRAALQRGPDGKIYITNPGYTNLNVINKPNLSGPDCAFAGRAITFPFRYPMRPPLAELGLPNVHSFDKPERYLRAKILDTVFYCEIPEISLMPQILTGTDYLWSNDSLGTQLRINDTGMYWVQYKVVSDCVTDYYTDTFLISWSGYKLDLLNKDTLICAGTAVDVSITSNPDFSYKWSPETGVKDVYSGNTMIITDSTRTYTVTASYPGCPDSSISFTIEVEHPSFSGYTVYPGVLCTGQSLTVKKIDPFGHGILWDWGDGSSYSTIADAIIHSYEQPGIMNIKGTALYKVCSDSGYVSTVHVHPIPYVSLVSDTFLCERGLPIILRNTGQVEEGNRYLWSTGDTTIELKITQKGKYGLTITNTYGCANSSSVDIEKACSIDIPNAFTPNGDGVNDYFYPRQYLSSGISRYRMQIFNKWGQLISETLQTGGRGWDGRVNGREQPAGVYIYRIDVILENGSEEKYEGNVTLIR